jgi:arylsulfatase A-like enzyme
MKPSHGHDQAIVNGVSRIGYMKGGKSALWVDEDMVDVLSSKACAFIDEHKEQPFFLYYATHDIHVPRMPNARFVGKTGMGPRGDAIAEMDWSVGEVLKALDRNGLSENTLVILSSDNGPVVDDGYQDQAVEKLGSHRPAGPYRGGKYSNFDAGTRVPFVVRWPGQIRADSQSNALISQLDLMRSLAALTGGTIPAGAAPDSTNQVAALLGKSKKGRTELVEHADALSLIQGNWKVIEPSKLPKMNRNTNTELGNNEEAQLYNLEQDPAEHHDLAKQQPERVAAMLKRLKEIRAQE